MQLQTYFDFNNARRNMVEGQLRTNKIYDDRLLEALRTTPRELFLPQSSQGIAYIDDDIDVGNGRYLMAPLPFARMVQEAMIQENEVVLDIGCTRGYSTAIFAKLAASVIGVDNNTFFLTQATEQLAHLEIANVIFHLGDFKEGFFEGGPYNVIFIEGMVDYIPDHLFQQLAKDGRLLAIVSEKESIGVAKLYQRFGDRIAQRDLFEAKAQFLPGFQKQSGFIFG